MGAPNINPIGFKCCKKCGNLKPLNEFHRYNKSADGRRYTCKQCRANNEGFEYKPPVADGNRRCCACGQEFPATTEYFFKKYKHGDLQSECKTCYQSRMAGHRRKHPEWGIQSSHARRQRIKSSGSKITSADVKLQLKSQKGLCWWCGKKLGKYHIDHLVPLARNGVHDPSNIVISCPHCNQSRGSKLPHEWSDRLL